MKLRPGMSNFLREVSMELAVPGKDLPGYVQETPYMSKTWGFNDGFLGTIYTSP